MKKGWKQYICKNCGGKPTSARIDSVCGILEICSTCARKVTLKTSVICFTCIHNAQCLDVTRTCLKLAQQN